MHFRRQRCGTGCAGKNASAEKILPQFCHDGRASQFLMAAVSCAAVQLFLVLMKHHLADSRHQIHRGRAHDAHVLKQRRKIAPCSEEAGAAVRQNRSHPAAPETVVQGHVVQAD